jgi:thioesterase domain-containing protein
VFLQGADQPIALHLGSRLGWKQFAQGGFDVHIIAGDHATLIERPNAAATAEKLARVLSHETQPQARAARPGA